MRKSDDLVLTDRYPPNFVHQLQLRNVSDDEPLFDYHTLVVSLLRRAGEKDKPSGDDTPFSPSEKYILNDFIQRFIQGLADKSLMQESISQNVLAGRDQSLSWYKGRLVDETGMIAVGQGAPKISKVIMILSGTATASARHDRSEKPRKST
ncbi:hypothetical protein E4U31_000665 [Claviceps sp. LM219 group G6]|nr:hypothetical protein E4U31_000665 [Claviceps sp. LM219 group G6]